MGKWDETLDALAELAQPEQWDFEGSAYCSKFILLQYLRYTFYRLDREKKVMQKLDDKGMVYLRLLIQDWLHALMTTFMHALNRLRTDILVHGA